MINKTITGLSENIKNSNSPKINICLKILFYFFIVTPKFSYNFFRKLGEGNKMYVKEEPFRNIQLTILDQLSVFPTSVSASEIQRAINVDCKGGRKFALGTVVTSLRRLEKKGLLIFSEDDAGRRLYKITEEGRNVLYNFLKSFKSVSGEALILAPSTG